MISTLIRGSSNSIPNTTRYREEYLVDTETNEIIYPKVLPSSITIPPSSDGTTPPPQLIGGGIDPSNYKTFSIDLTNKKFTNQGLTSQTLKIFDIEDPGLYIIAMDVNLTEIIVPLNNPMHNMEISITRQPSGSRVFGHKGFMDKYGWFRITLSNIIMISDNDKSLRLWYWANETFTLKSGNIVVSYIKLCNLTNTAI